LVSKQIKRTDFAKANSYSIFELSFEIQFPTEGIEFRIFYTGTIDLFFEKTELIEIK